MLSKDQTLALDCLRTENPDIPQLLNLKHRKYGYVDMFLLNKMDLNQTIPSMHGEWKNLSFDLINAAYINENYYEYFNHCEDDPNLESENTNFRSPDSHHNIYKPFKEGQLSSLFYSKNQRSKKGKLKMSLSSYLDDDEKSKKGYFVVWV